MTEGHQSILQTVLDHTDLFKTLGRMNDSNENFDRSVLDIFSQNEIESLIQCCSENSELTPDSEAECFFHTGKYCSNIRNFFLVSVGMVATTIEKFGSSKQRESFLQKFSDKKAIGCLALTETDVGSNLKAIKTSYRKDGNTFIINGHKRWITLGGIADVILLAANGEDGILFFLIDTNEHVIEREEMRGILSNKGSHIAELTFTGIKLSAEDVLGENNFNSAPALQFALMNGRSIAAISAVAMAQAALEEAIEYAKKRQQFNKRIIEHQLIQKMIGEAAVNITAGQLLSLKAFKEKRESSAYGMHYCTQAKLFTSKAFQKIAEDCLQILGGNGMLSEYNLERYYREARAFQFIEGTSEILVQMVARGTIMGPPRLW